MFIGFQAIFMISRAVQAVKLKNLMLVSEPLGKVPKVRGNLERQGVYTLSCIGDRWRFDQFRALDRLILKKTERERSLEAFRMADMVEMPFRTSFFIVIGFLWMVGEILRVRTGAEGAASACAVQYTMAEPWTCF